MSDHVKRVVQVAASMLLWIGATFACAGTLRWTRGWICTAVYLGVMTAVGVAVRIRNPVIYEARSKWRHSDTKRFDKVVLAIYMPFTYIQPAVAGLDAVRFRWTSMPFWTVWPGIALFVAAMGLVSWVMMVNRFAETTVRIQTDRAHTVVSAGPYRWVRHPMYVGAILMYPATALMLGSMWAMAVAGLIAALMVVRTALEDWTLRRELEGYEEFTTRTKWRLAPGIW